MMYTHTRGEPAVYKHARVFREGRYEHKSKPPPRRARSIARCVCVCARRRLCVCFLESAGRERERGEEEDTASRYLSFAAAADTRRKDATRACLTPFLLSPPPPPPPPRANGEIPMKYPPTQNTGGGGGRGYGGVHTHTMGINIHLRGFVESVAASRD